MAIEFEVSALIAASPQEIYNTWLSSAGHTKMTGSPASASAVTGVTFTAWDGYIEGTNLELDQDGRIVQAWRTTEFETSDPYSRLEILLQAQEGGTLLTIRHSNLPEHGMQYRQGWIDAYFTPMADYFASAAVD